MFFQLSLVMLKTQKGHSKNVSKQLQRKIRLVNPRNHKKPTCPLGFVQEDPKQSRNKQTQNFESPPSKNTTLRAKCKEGLFGNTGRTSEANMLFWSVLCFVCVAFGSL